MSRKIAAFGVAAGLAALVGMQLIRPPRRNPPSDPAASFEAVVAPPQAVRDAVGRACRNCHSNETVWPWYSRVAPVSWLVARDVEQGRLHLNLSEWGRFGPRLSVSRIADMCEEVTAGEMPVWYFTLVHPNARLTRFEVAELCSLPAARSAAAQARP